MTQMDTDQKDKNLSSSVSSVDNSVSMMTGFKLNCRQFLALAAVTCSALLAGCGEGHVRFHLDRVAADKFAVGEAQQQQITDVLTAAFGTPDEPVVMDATGLDIDMIRRASGPVHRDALEGPKGLYREHCVHCHGINGDGAGTTAAFIAKGGTR